MKHHWVKYFVIPAILFVAGCGPKPIRNLPAGLSVESITESLRNQASVVRTFSGWAKVRLRESGEEQSSTAVIRYIRPDRYRVNLLGFGGVELAEIGSDGDSITVYIPHYQSYLRESAGSNPLSAIMPELEIDLERLVSVVNGVSLPPGALDRYRTTLRVWDQYADLIFEENGTAYRYRVSGPEFTVIEETVTRGGALVWQVTRNDFQQSGNVLFPRKVSLRDPRRMLLMDFSSLAVNSGVSDEDVILVVPDDAERLFTRN